MKLNELVAVAVRKFETKESFTERNGDVYFYRCYHAAAEAIEETVKTGKVAAQLCAEADSRSGVKIKLDVDCMFEENTVRSILQHLLPLLVEIVTQLMLQDRNVAREDQARDRKNEQAAY